MQTNPDSHNYSHLAQFVSIEKLPWLINVLEREFPIKGKGAWNVGDYALHQRETQGIGELVKVVRLPLPNETHFKVITVSEYANNVFFAEEYQLEKLIDAQQRILAGIRNNRLPRNYLFMHVFEAEQLQLLQS